MENETKELLKQLLIKLTQEEKPKEKQQPKQNISQELLNEWRLFDEFKRKKKKEKIKGTEIIIPEITWEERILKSINYLGNLEQTLKIFKELNISFDDLILPKQKNNTTLFNELNTFYNLIQQLFNSNIENKKFMEFYSNIYDLMLFIYEIKSGNNDLIAVINRIPNFIQRIMNVNKIIIYLYQNE